MSGVSNNGARTGGGMVGEHMDLQSEIKYMKSELDKVNRHIDQFPSLSNPLYKLDQLITEKAQLREGLNSLLEAVKVAKEIELESLRQSAASQKEQGNHFLLI